MMPNELTKEQAIAAMKEGNKVTHLYFTDDEWVKSDKEGDIYTFDDGVSITSKEFWNLRSINSYNKGWFIKK